MVDPASGPFLFDTSAESWLARTRHSDSSELDGTRTYRCHPFHVSAVTVLERIRGYSLLWRRADVKRRETIESARVAYLSALGQVWPLDGAVAVVAGEIMALLPDLPPRHRSHHLAESRQERLARWRFDGMIAATALVARMPLIHNNAADFEPVRSAIEKSPSAVPSSWPAGVDPLRFPGVKTRRVALRQRPTSAYTEASCVVAPTTRFDFGTGLAPESRRVALA